jgi:predicted membrane protein
MAMTRTTLFTAGAAAIALAAAAIGFGAYAQTAPDERIVGYAVDAHSQYVLLQKTDGRLRSCIRQRATAIRTKPQWDCTDLDPLP